MVQGVASSKTFLKMSALLSKARLYYVQALEQFKALVLAEAMLVWPAPALDLALVSYFNAMYFLGHHASKEERLLAALVDERPVLGRHGDAGVSRSGQALKGWRKRTPSRMRTPEPYFI